MTNDKDYFRKLAEKYLDERATEQECEELFDWMKDNDELRTMLYEDLEASDKEMPESKKLRVYKNIVSAGQPDTKPRHRTLFTATRMLAAACVALALVAGALVYSQAGQAEVPARPLEVRTEATNRSKVNLPDGTVVHVNAQSTLSYRLDDKRKERIVHLDGEGYFEVAPDKKNPFKIITNGMELLCLGTKFDIKNYEDDSSARVILREGSVRVTSGKQAILMTPGTCVTYNKNTGRLSQSKVQKDRAVDWIRGYTYYQNESLENIANELSRNYGKRFVITSPEMSKETFSGYLGKTSLSDMLHALSTASGISYEYINDSTVHLFNTQK